MRHAISAAGSPSMDYRCQWHARRVLDWNGPWRPQPCRDLREPVQARPATRYAGIAVDSVHVIGRGVDSDLPLGASSRASAPDAWRSVAVNLVSDSGRPEAVPGLSTWASAADWTADTAHVNELRLLSSESIWRRVWSPRRCRTNSHATGCRRRRCECVRYTVGKLELDGGHYCRKPWSVMRQVKLARGSR